MDKVAEIVNDNKEGEIWFNILDMQYAFGQTVLHPETANIAIFRLWEENRLVHMRLTQDIIDYP